ncbi:MAG TPA: VWA domain-containing protein [Gemmataceae bacterium]|nr:VWA domain-containing protein [Gemmataceae bacterium]
MIDFLVQHWLAFTLLLAALGLGIATAVRRARSGEWPWRLYLPALVLASYAGGGILADLADFAWWIGLTICIAAFVVFVGMLVLVIVNGLWSAYAGYGLTGVFFFGLGAWTAAPLADALHYAGAFLLSVRVQYYWWFLLLGLIPLLIWASWRNLLGLGETRRWIVIGLRSALIMLLALALAEVYARKPNDSVTVIFLWDRSYSMPPEPSATTGKDLREKRIFDFINDSVAKRGTKHANDRVGVIVFGKQPKLELPPHAVPRLGFAKIMSQVDPSYTDIGAAMKLALASFPEGSGKRIVLISDGNENMGRAEEQARMAKQNGVEVDIVPIAEGRKHQNEVLVERLEAPAVTEKDSRLPLRVVIRSFHPEIVVARLQLRKITFDPAGDARNDKDNNRLSPEVKLRQGLNVFYFQQAGAKDDTVAAYEATVIPLRVETVDGRKKADGLPGDRIDNNEARVTVMSRGERAMLLLRPDLDNEDKGDDETHQTLIDQLRASTKGLKVVPMTPNQLRNLTKGDNERLATFLSKFDAVVLANVPAEAITPEEQKVIRSHVHDQGAGLIMIGGNKSFGAGGWQNTEVEKALPVTMDLKSMKVEGKSGLVMIMHASEIADGNSWQRKIAKLALEKLSPMDMVGQIHYDHGFNGGAPGHRWHIPFQEVGPNRKKLLGMVDSMEPGDMPDVDPAFIKAHKELTNAEYQLGTKHIILISDGDHWDASPAVLNKLRASKITCTTVCITSHGQAEVNKMKAVAQFLKGRSYHITDPKELPAIYIKETRLVSQSFVHEKRFLPHFRDAREGPTEGLKGELPPLHGFVRTTPRESSLVKILIETEKIGKYKFPVLAAWQYGLGKSVAFTSDARTIKDGKAFWDRDWASEEMYTKFWSQTINWVLRPTETGKHLFMTTEQKDGKIRIIVEARDADKVPLTDVELKAGITSPAFKEKNDKKAELKFEQRNAGTYEAEIPADEVGAYFINIQAKWKKDGQDMVDNVRAGVTIPYSPEFAEMDSNAQLLERISDQTGGQSYFDNETSLQEAVAKSSVFRPVPESLMSLQPLWSWMVALTALCLLLDVAVRRIAIQPEAVWAKATEYWDRLRGRAVAEEKLPAYIERLKSRKATVGESLEKQKAAKKFETAEGAKPADAPTIASASVPEKPKETPKKQEPKKDKEKEEDFASRLMKAKKKAMEDRDKDKK